MSRIDYMSASVWVQMRSSGPWERGVVTDYVFDSQNNWADFKIALSLTVQQKREGEREREAERGGEGESKEELETVTIVREVELRSELSLVTQEFVSVKRRESSLSLSLSMAEVRDMISLSNLNEPEMLECIRCRFDIQKIYTNIGPIIIATNPFEPLPLYGAERIKEYCQGDPNKLEPHLYSLAQSAYTKMFVDKFDREKRENQSILVNGESGAGKTESTKHVLRFLAGLSTSVVEDLIGTQCAGERRFEELVFATNPITESFGNAKTSRNNNSSRFGKFIELSYAAEGYIVGASMSTYLLETIRVTFQTPGERNYHVFYELAAGLSEDRKRELNFNPLTTYRYTSGQQVREDGESDADNCNNLLNALRQIGLNEETIKRLSETLVGILYLGNLNLISVNRGDGQYATEFDPAPANQSSVNSVCKLFQINANSLLGAMTRSSMEPRPGERIVTILGVPEATAARDTLAQKIYNSIFGFMITSINKSLTFEETGEAVSKIGILDIFGFEFFQQNSFEQLCINYANETLQNHFNFAIFESEKRLYKEEELQWTVFEYPDNSRRIALFDDSSKGIFSICNDIQKTTTDDSLARSMYRICDKEFFKTTKIGENRREFTINHYACPVTYTTTGFVEKNRIQIPQEMEECLRGSQSEFFKELFPVPVVAEHSLNTGINKSKTVPKKNTVAKQFTSQLGKLVETIRQTRSHFIRCIKPNNKLCRRLFDDVMVIDQLRCGGALGAVQVFRAGLPNRMSFSDFSKKYGIFLCISGQNSLTRRLALMLRSANLIRDECLWRATCTEILKNMQVFASILDLIEKQASSEGIDLNKGLQMGKSRLFMSAVVFEYIEALYSRAVNRVVSQIQKRYKIVQGYKRLQRREGDSIELTRMLGQLKAVCSFAEYRRTYSRIQIISRVLIQRRVRKYLCRLKTLRSNSATQIQRIGRGKLARKLFVRLKKEAEEQAEKARRAEMERIARLRREEEERARRAAMDKKEREKLEQEEKKAQELQRLREIARANIMTAFEQKLNSNPNFLRDAEQAMTDNVTLKQRVSSLESEVAELRSRCEMYAKEKESANSALGLLQTESSSLRSEVISSKERQEQTDLELSTIQSNLTELRNTVQILEEKRAEYASTNSRLQSELEISRQELDVSNLRMSELQSNHNRVLEDVEAARARVMELMSECEGTGADNAELSASLEEARLVCARLESDLIMTQNEKDTYADKLKELEVKRSQLENEIINLAECEEEARTELLSTQSEMDEFQKRLYIPTDKFREKVVKERRTVEELEQELMYRHEMYAKLLFRFGIAQKRLADQKIKQDDKIHIHVDSYNHDKKVYNMTIVCGSDTFEVSRTYREIAAINQTSDLRNHDLSQIFPDFPLLPPDLLKKRQKIILPMNLYFQHLCSLEDLMARPSVKQAIGVLIGIIL